MIANGRAPFDCYFLFMVSFFSGNDSQCCLPHLHESLVPLKREEKKKKKKAQLRNAGSGFSITLKTADSIVIRLGQERGAEGRSLWYDAPNVGNIARDPGARGFAVRPPSRPLLRRTRPHRRRLVSPSRIKLIAAAETDATKPRFDNQLPYLA